jgi:hypothetical protein
VLKFLYITTDPFVNQTEEFVRMLAIASYAIAGSATVGSTTNFGATLIDPNGYPVGYFDVWQNYLNTESTAYPYSMGGFLAAQPIIIIPPGWKFSNFLRAIAVQGTLEEVLRVH